MSQAPKLSLTKFVIICTLPDDWTSPEELHQILSEANYDVSEIHPDMLKGYLEELVAQGYIEAHYQQSLGVFYYRGK